MINRLSIVAALALAGSLHAFAADVISNTAEAEAARKKPLQRCDQLKDKAGLDCLNQARERIVDARKKRESAGEARSADKKSDTPAAAKPGKDKQ